MLLNMAARHNAALAHLGISTGSSPMYETAAPPQELQHDKGADEGIGLRSFLLDRYKRGKLPASTLSTLCWHATRAGAANVADLACSPSQSEKHAADHVRRAIAVRAKNTFYIAQAPMKCNEEAGVQRLLCEFPMNLPHVDFARQYKEAPDQFKVALHGDPPPPLTVGTRW